MVDLNRVLVRAKSEEQKQRWQAAAKLEGKSFNSWAAEHLDQAAVSPEFPKVGPRVMVITKGEHQGYRLKLLTDLVRSIEASYDCEVVVMSGDESCLTVYDVPIPNDERLNYHVRLMNIELAEEKAS